MLGEACLRFRSKPQVVQSVSFLGQTCLSLSTSNVNLAALFQGFLSFWGGFRSLQNMYSDPGLSNVPRLQKANERVCCHRLLQFCFKGKQLRRVMLQIRDELSKWPIVASLLRK